MDKGDGREPRQRKQQKQDEMQLSATGIIKGPDAILGEMAESDATTALTARGTGSDEWDFTQ